MGVITNIQVEKSNEQIQKLRKTVYDEVRAKYDIETLKDDQTVRAYRDLYWRLGIDPTKTRPSGEALLRRVLHGSELPNISTAVDAYNLASMKTMVPISGFDKDLLTPPLQIRFSKEDVFTGIGMTEAITLAHNNLVLTDENQILCVYPYRDSNSTKITKQTRNVALIGYGAPGIKEEQLEEAVKIALAYIKQTSEGESEMTQILRK